MYSSPPAIGSANALKVTVMLFMCLIFLTLKEPV